MNPVVAKKLTEKAAKSKTARRMAIVSVVTTAAVFFVVPVFVILVAAGGFEGESSPSEVAQAEIPVEVLQAYVDAAEVWEIDWWILAGVGKVECDHGRYQADGCNPPGTMNEAGARGYMQFIGSTWRTTLGQHEMEPRTSPPAPDGRGWATDGDGDGYADPWNWDDATHSAARYLVDMGIHDDVEAAIWAYNHSDSYVAEVLAHATRYQAAGDAVLLAAVPTSPVGPDEIVTVRGVQVHESIAGNVDALLAAADTAGFTTLSGWGYRSSEGQIAVRKANCGTTTYAIYEMPSSSCSPPTAPPGSSMHERGLAIDFTIDGRAIPSRSTAIFQWLAANAAQYGFYNLPSEPWHWSVNAR